MTSIATSHPSPGSSKGTLARIRYLASCNSEQRQGLSHTLKLRAQSIIIDHDVFTLAVMLDMSAAVGDVEGGDFGWSRNLLALALPSDISRGAKWGTFACSSVCHLRDRRCKVKKIGRQDLLATVAHHGRV